MLTDRTVIAWLLLTAAVLALRPPALPLVGLHLLAVAVILWTGCAESSLPGWARQLHRWYPYAILPLLYRELDILSRICSGGYHDVTVRAWEQSLFGSQPSQWLSEVLPYHCLSEVLHCGYATFYAMLPLLCVVLLWRGKEHDFDRVMWTGIGTFLLCYLGSMLFPVQGPRLLSPPLAADLQGFWWRLSHALCHGGAADAAAFPSGHAAVSAAMAVCARRCCPGLFPLYALWAAAIALATIYGRFHYAVDVLAGWAVAGLVLCFARRLFSQSHRPG